MIQILSAKKLSALFLVLIIAMVNCYAQKVKRPEPKWWFGVSGAANINFYRGTTQMLNNTLSVPTAFHKGDGVKPYVSILTEYRPNKVLGGMLNIAFDNRGGRFNEVMAPCDCPANLSTNISNIAIEPSLRLAPFSNAFYIFGGPTLGINLSKGFEYTQQRQTDKKGDWSDMRKMVLSAQAGAGIDIPVSARTSATQVTFSPFVSFQTDLGHEPRAVESWSFYTYRAGLAIKFGKTKKPTPAVITSEPVAPTPAIVLEKEVTFTVTPPKYISINRNVTETFPLRNSVFFDNGSAEIPNRYVKLTNAQASVFKEEQLQANQPDNLNKGRSNRQLTVYYNILNIIGDRMRTHPQSTITLTGASEKNPAEGRRMADDIRQYLVSVFDISPSRINIEGRDKPVIPSEQPGATKELSLLREGDRRVDIVSGFPELMEQVGGDTPALLNPVKISGTEEDPLDSQVLFNVNGAKELLKYWSVAVTDEQGTTKNFGPYSTDQEYISGKTILGNNTKGNYTITMMGETKTGNTIKKESFVSLVKSDDPKQAGLRYSILFDFDKSKTIASYERFLIDIVTPLIPENSIVVIHGHTDIIGDEKYNQNLSLERATSAQQIIEAALMKTGRKGVTFETYGFGEDADKSPFENKFPEERFYNRTVIIDIIPSK